MWADCVLFWRGFGSYEAHAYTLTEERQQRLEAVLGDTVTPATEGQGWIWSWNDWDWTQIAKGGR